MQGDACYFPLHQLILPCPKGELSCEVSMSKKSCILTLTTLPQNFHLGSSFRLQAGFHGIDYWEDVLIHLLVTQTTFPSCPAFPTCWAVFVIHVPPHTHTLPAKATGSLPLNSGQHSQAEYDQLFHENHSEQVCQWLVPHSFTYSYFPLAATIKHTGASCSWLAIGVIENPKINLGHSLNCI